MSATYDVILADPPWRYSFSRSDSRKVENQYPTMTVEDICALPVPAAPNCVLYLWATAPKLLEALAVMKAWGFQYVTQAVWDKGVIGMGYWFRGRHEILLVGVKGKVSPPAPLARVPSVICARRSEHSRKPVEVYELIERAFPEARRLEMFARARREEWDAWGNEVEAQAST